MTDYLEQYCIDNRDKLYRLAYSYARNQEDALDIVSASIVKALKGRREIANPGAVKTWMYRIVVNTALDWLRGQGRYQLMPLEELLLLPSSDSYRDEDLHQAVAALPEPYHSIIVLRYFEDLKISDVADILQSNVNTVKSQLYAAHKKLRIALEEEEVSQ